MRFRATSGLATRSFGTSACFPHDGLRERRLWSQGARRRPGDAAQVPGRDARYRRPRRLRAAPHTPAFRGQRQRVAVCPSAGAQSCCSSARRAVDGGRSAVGPAAARRDQSSTSAAWRDDCWCPTTGRIRVVHPNEPSYLGPVTSSPLLKTVNAQEGLEILPSNRHTVERHGHHSIRSRFLALVPFSRPRVTQSLAHRPATSGDRPEVATSSAHSALPGRPSALVWVWLHAVGPQILNTLTAAHSTAFRPPRLVRSTDLDRVLL